MRLSSCLFTFIKLFVYIFQVADTDTNSFLNWIDSCDDHNYNHNGSKSIKKDFFCEYCLKKFSKLTDVKKHIVNEHNDKIDESKISKEAAVDASEEVINKLTEHFLLLFGLG